MIDIKLCLDSAKTEHNTLKFRNSTCVCVCIYVYVHIYIHQRNMFTLFIVRHVKECLYGII